MALKNLYTLYFVALTLFASITHGEEVQVESDGIILSAELLIPKKAVCETCPLIVIVQGSGDSDRTNPWTAAWASALVENGVSVLHTDKRGSGQSGGDWKKVGFERLAADVRAFVHTLAQHERIDDSRIGVMGFSQGGHVVSMFSKSDAPVDFVISLSASVVPMDVQILNEALLRGKQAGLTAVQLSAISRIHDLAMQYADGEKPYSEVESALDLARANGLSEYDFVNEFPGPDIVWLWEWLDMVKDFDPMQHWSKAAKPVLFIYGGRDQNIDVKQSATLIQDELLGLDKSISLVVHGENGHALFRNDTVALVASFALHGGKND